MGNYRKGAKAKAQSTKATRQLATPIKTGKKTTTTHEGDTAHVRKPKAELFVLAVNYMGEQENTFYETGADRQSRFVDLVHKVTKKDPEWMKGFLPFLRNEAFMRTAPMVAACEYVAAGGPNGASVIDSVIRRADEPAEVLAYWTIKYGRNIPFPIRKGLNKAARRLYTERNALKWDGGGRGVRMADVLELCHTKPTSAWQADLFAYLLDRRHNPTEIRASLDQLPTITKARALNEMPRTQRREFIEEHGGQPLIDAEFTWEMLSEWIPGGMDALAWESIIPGMGYMGLLRNLRNFDEKGVSDEVAAKVATRLSDEKEVAVSMQFPFRFLSAYKHAQGTNRWALALDRALDFSTSNIPKLTGKSLVLVDVSGSMSAPLSTNSSLLQYEAGAVFGVAQFRAAGFQGDLVAFGTDSEKIPLKSGTSVLKGTEALLKLASSGKVGHGTNTWEALARHYDGHDRVFIFTDMQSFGSYGYGFNNKSVLDQIRVPIYNWNLVGYRGANMEIGTDLHYEMAGLSDVTFRQIAMLEQMNSTGWPWEETATA